MNTPEETLYDIEFTIRRPGADIEGFIAVRGARRSILVGEGIPPAVMEDLVDSYEKELLDRGSCCVPTDKDDALMEMLQGLKDDEIPHA